MQRALDGNSDRQTATTGAQLLRRPCAAIEDALLQTIRPRNQEMGIIRMDVINYCKIPLDSNASF